MDQSQLYLVTGPAAPMNLISPSWVYNLSHEQLEYVHCRGGSICPEEASSVAKAGKGAGNWQEYFTVARVEQSNLMSITYLRGERPLQTSGDEKTP